MFLISKKSKQLFMAAGLALGIVALGACSGGGGSIQSPVAPNQPASPAGTWSQTLSPAGMSANLPSVAGFSETLTVPANNASAGTTLTVKVSGSVPAGLPAIDPDLHMVKSFLYFTVTASKTVTLNGFPGFTLVAPPHFDYGNFPVKIAYFDPKTGWTHVGDMTYSAGTLTFVPTRNPIALVANTTYYVIPYTCGGPSPSPTPTGVISCTASGTGAIGVLCKSGKTYAFVGKGLAGQKQVEQIDISKGATANSTAAPTKVYATTFQPTECSGDETNQIVFCGGFSSGELTDINATAQTNADFSTGATGSLGFSGGSCTICAIAFDPKDTAFIIGDPNPSGSGAGQFQRVPEAAPHTINETLATSDLNENFGFDYVKNWVFNPFYNGNQLQVLNVTTGGIFTQTTGVSGISTPDSATVDVATHVGETPNEGGDVITMADLGTATMSGGVLTVTTGQTSTTHTNDEGLDNDATATDSVLHLTFLAGEFGTNHLGFALLPTTSTGTTISDWAYALFPNTPDGAAWSSAFDPHPVAAFNDPVNCPDCALSINQSTNWLAVIDLNKLKAAPRKSGDVHTIDPTYDLEANHVLSYYKI